MQKSIELTARKIVQSGKTFYISSMPAKTLIACSKVAIWKAGQGPEGQGYQREPLISRHRRFSRFLQGKLAVKEPILPTSIFLNSRSKLKFTLEGDGWGRLTIPVEALPLWAVDGQHRKLGFDYAINYGGLKQFEDFELPVVIAEGLDVSEEMLQFYVINTEAKKVRTDLAHRLLLQQAKDPDVKLRMVEEGKDWLLAATSISHELNMRKDSPWFGRIQTPNNASSGLEIAKEVSFSTSLKPLVDGDTFPANQSEDVIVELLVRYWNGWRSLLPDAFNDASEYVIQKTPGLFALHQIAPTVFDIARADGHGLSQQAVETIIRHITEDSDVGGSVFWEKDNEEGASQYGSMKAFRILANRLKSALPQLRAAVAI